MKKTLLLLLALLGLGVSGAWAETLNIGSLTSSSVTFGSGNYVSSITTQTTPIVTISSRYNDISTSGDSKIYAPASGNNGGVETYTMTVAEGYVITGYSFTATYSTGEITITPQMGGAAKTVVDGTSAEVSVSNISARTTYFDFAGPGSITPAIISDLTITVEEASYGLADGLYTITYTSGYGSHYMTSSAGLGAYGNYSSASDAGIFRVAYNATTGNYTIQEVSSGKYLGAVSSVLSTTTTPISCGNSNALELSSDASAFTSRWSLEATETYYRVHPAGNAHTSIAVWAGTNSYLSFHEETNGYAHARATFNTPTLSQMLNGQLSFSDIITAGYTIEQIRAQLISDNTIVNAGSVGYPSAEAWSTFQETVNAFTAESTYDDLATAKSTLFATIQLPTTGFYYFHNIGSGRYAFSDEETSTTRDYLNDETRSTKHIWHVTLEDNSVYLHSLTGKGIQSDKGEHTNALALTSAYSRNLTAAYGGFYVGYLQDPMQTSFTLLSEAYASATNPMGVASYSGGDGDINNAKAYWKFESVDLSAYDVYSVTFVNAPSNNYVQYTGEATTGNKKVYDGGWYLITKDAAVAASDFTPEAIENYSTEVTIEGKAITVTYTVDTYLGQVNENIKPFIDNPGTGYFQITQDYADALQGAITTANEDNVITESEYNELLTYLNNCIKMPQTGYYRIKSAGARQVGESYIAYGRTSGSSYTGLITKATDEGVTDYSTVMKLTKLANGKYTISTQGLNIQGVTKSTIVQASNATGVEFTFTPAPASGAYATITNSGDEYQYFHESAWTEENYTYNAILGWAASAGASKWALEKVDDITLTLNGPIDDKYYATLCLPFAVTVSGAEAYTLTLNANKDGLTLSDALTEIPAGTPVLLRGSNATATAAIAANADYVSAPLTTTSLTGTFVDKAVTAGTDYFLGKDDTNVGFYKWNGTTLKANRAYLEAAALSAAGVKGFALNFDTETAIKAIADETPVLPVYNLAGQRVQKATRGIYIVNGKKVVIK